MAKINIYDLPFLSSMCLINRNHGASAILTQLRNLWKKYQYKTTSSSITCFNKGKRNLLYQFKVLDITNTCGGNAGSNETARHFM